jgi:hypothetical protein
VGNPQLVTIGSQFTLTDMVGKAKIDLSSTGPVLPGTYAWSTSARPRIRAAAQTALA